MITVSGLHRGMEKEVKIGVHEQLRIPGIGEQRNQTHVSLLRYRARKLLSLWKADLSWDTSSAH